MSGAYTNIPTATPQIGKSVPGVLLSTSAVCLNRAALLENMVIIVLTGQKFIYSKF